MTTNNVLTFTRPAPPRPKRSRPAGKPQRVRRRRTHFTATHPLAEAARQRCLDLRHRAVFPGRYIGTVACDQCWEAAIRADERVVVEYDLDDADPVAPDDLDEIALERATRGDRVRLSRHERTVAIFRMHADGLTDNAIAKRLHIAQRDVQAVLDLFTADTDTPAAAPTA